MIDETTESIHNQLGNGRKGIRSKIDIIADILEICIDASKVRKTPIMQRANLNTPMTDYYLNYMTKKQLIHKDESGCFCVTEKGIVTLKWYERIMELAG